MFSAPIYFQGLAIVAIAAVCTWVLSLFRRNVAVVDSVWSLLFVLAAFTYFLGAGQASPHAASARALMVLSLATIWALRLSIYITWRNWGHGEDRRYQAIRSRNQPLFALKSLYLIFILQAVLAWIISLPLLGSILNSGPLRVLDFLGAALWAVGFAFETAGDWQLARFKSDPANQGRVMDRGLWRYTRHPNYFGDFCVWWGFYLIGVSAGAWWSIIGPALMSMLLLKVSGVALLERDIDTRRPRYAEYIRRTNAFFPGIPKQR